MLKTLKLLYGYQSISYRSTKTAQEVKVAFSERLNPIYSMTLFKRPIKGYLKDNEIFLYRQPSSLFTELIWPIGKIDFFYPIFKGNILCLDGGTSLNGILCINLGAKIFLTFVYLFLLSAFIALNIVTFEIYIETNPPLIALFLKWVIGFSIISVIVYFINVSIRQATLPHRQIYSELSKFIEECIKVKTQQVAGADRDELRGFS